MAKLRTRPWRILAAIAVGLTSASLTQGVLSLLFTDPMLRDPTFGLVMGLVGGAALMVVPGLPLWLILHRRGAHAWAPALAGGLSAALAILSAVLISATAVSVRVDGVMLFGTAVIILASAAAAAATCALMWRIAYPRALQGPREEVF